MLRLITFGGLRLEATDGRSSLLDAQRKSLGLLVLLAGAGARGASRDKLLAWLWPESSDERARGALKQMLHGIKRELEVPRLTLGARELRLNPEAITSDLADFEAALARGNPEGAVAVYRGPFLDGFHLRDVPEFERWVEEERSRLARAAAGALESLATRAAEAGDHRDAADWWRRLTAHDPFSARAALGLMAALTAVGDRAGALHCAGSYERRMEEELGVPPDPAVAAFAREIRAGAGAAVTPPPPSPATLPLAGAASATPAPPAAALPLAAGQAEIPTPRGGAAGPRIPRRALAYALGGAALAVAAYIGASASGLFEPAAPKAGAARAAPAIAVLPFLDLSPDHDAEYFSDGFAEELITALTQVDGLRVVARTSSFAFRDAKLDVAEIGRRLNVPYVLEGSVRTAGTQLRITAQLINAADNYHLWARTYVRELNDIFAIQEEISRAIVDALELELVGSSRARLASQAPADMAAYHDYLRGRYYFNAREPHALDSALHYYERAVAIDPRFAPAHAGLAEALTQRSALGFAPPNDAMPRARRSALRALELDPELSAAHAALGHVQTWYEWDWSGAEASFERALALGPANAAAHHWYSVYLASVGRLAEAIAANERAIELDPVAVLLRTTLGIRHYLARDYQRALDEFQATLELAPAHGPALAWRGVVLAQVGDAASAVSAADRGYHEAPWPMVGAWRAYAYAAAGRSTEARAQLRALEEQGRDGIVPASVVARAYGALGERDAAFTWLERAYRERDGWLSFLAVDPAFDPLRADPRFGQLLARLGLPSVRSRVRAGSRRPSSMPARAPPYAARETRGALRRSAAAHRRCQGAGCPARKCRHSMASSVRVSSV
ncbi:MAG TPA: BTAD domain-containing putative transcriptional regulator [Longimicrobiales bacterium]|nr:BTAD domain-containing putative transcriptional regulator [Longimicrobiales bacterium]